MLQREIDVGFETSTTALSDAGMTLGEFPVVKHIGNKDEKDAGIVISMAFERKVGARMPITIPMSQTTVQLDQKLRMVRSTSLHPYTCFRASVGSANNQVQT